MYYGHYPARDAVLQKRFDLYDGFFYDYLLDFAERSPHRALSARLLYNGGYAFAGNNEAEKAKHFIQQLKRQYADQVYVESGLADKVLAGMKVIPGQKAPDFTVSLLSGEEISLSDLEGRFVLLDFWGSWCAPCVREIPNLFALRGAVASDSLYILGIASDDPDELKSFIKEKSIPYSNAMVTDDLEMLYGITAYPTSFLIDPDGLIAGKNLGGPDLTMLVREKIRDYYASK
jgi:peroxiredoxin